MVSPIQVQKARTVRQCTCMHRSKLFAMEMTKRLQRIQNLDM